MKLGFLVGLGFGIIESLEYVILLHTPILIKLPDMFFHAANTSIVGYGIANKKPAVFYLVAVGLHFSNNAAAVILGFSPFPTAPAILAALLIPITFIVTLTVWHNLYRKTPEAFIPY
jgi:RsiW-degrading membrane proteinase PrsW (M82 family)